MKKSLLILSSIFVCALVNLPIHAKSMGCGLTENATISISFNGNDSDAAAVKNKLDSKIHEIEELAKGMALDKFEVQSMNYNINPINNGEGDSDSNRYQYSGSAGFVILPADKAVDLMVVLSKKGYHPSINVSSYRNGNGNCEQSSNLGGITKR